jgi:tetratricopeptide (TPR) repeat protein
MPDCLNTPRRASRKLAAGFWLAASLAGCSANTAHYLVGNDIAASAQIDQVPFVAQEDRYCGPASLAMAVNWSGTDVSQEEMASQVFTPGAEGTYRADMISAARRNGRLAVEISTLEELFLEVSAGHPVIVFQNLGLRLYPRWHYAVVTGYDLRQEVIYLHTGDRQNEPVNLTLFSRTWKRGDNWGLVVLPPDELPASGDAWHILDAAAALESIGRLEEAEQTYRAVSARWPENWLAPFGLGNALYARSQYGEAEAAYGRALALNRQAAVVWNNLANALLRLEKKDAARSAAVQAILLDETNAGSYRLTLWEIERSP